MMRTTLDLLRASRQHVFKGTMRYPGQKSKSLEMKQISLAGLPLISTFINLEIKRAHVIKCHKSRNQISGWWKDIETGLAKSDKHTTSSWVLWALNHSSPHAALLHMDHTHSFGLGWVSCLPHNYLTLCSTSHLYFCIQRHTINWTICCMVKGLEGFQVTTLEGFLTINPIRTGGVGSALFPHLSRICV